MTRMITLVVPDGDAYSYPISYGTEAFRPYLRDTNDPMSVRLVNVTPEAAIYFLHNGGFSMYEQPALGPMDFIPNTRVRHPDGLSCGWRGVAYEPDEDGVCIVAAAAVAELEPHGFVRLPDKTEVVVESLTEAPVESMPAEEGAEGGDDQPRGRRGRKN